MLQDILGDLGNLSNLMKIIVKFVLFSPIHKAYSVPSRT